MTKDNGDLSQGARCCIPRFGGVPLVSEVVSEEIGSECEPVDAQPKQQELTEDGRAQIQRDTAGR